MTIKRGVALLLRKGLKLGKKIEKINIGDRLHITEKIEDKDLLLYLGLTNDSNPLYLQHDYTKETPYKKPIVPTIMLTGIITSAISKVMPGPGSHIREQHLVFSHPVYHYETIEIELEIIHKEEEINVVEVSVNAFNEEQQQVIEGVLKVHPPS